MLYIFDWDGTLCRSLDHIVASIDFAARQVGLPTLSVERRSSVVGLGLNEALADLYPDTDAEQRLALFHHYRDCYLTLDQADPSPLYEGVEETLDYLQSCGHELAVATGKARQGLDRVMGNLGVGHRFIATRCADEARSKPDPLMLLQILEMTGYSADQALVIGDTDFDLNMANRANIGSIGVTYGAHPQDRLLACTPRQLIADIRELQQQPG
jgi:phosphoglycolate phosphatase